MTAILKDFPDYFESSRLLIRSPKPGDGKAINEAILESFDELHAWMPWAKERPTLDQSEEVARSAAAKFLLREDLQLLLFLKNSNTLVGSSGLHRINWDVPKFEIGYWCRSTYTGKGYITEAVARITQFAFEVLQAKRVEIKMDSNNSRSIKIPQTLGFTLEGTLLNDSRDTKGEIRHTNIFSLLSLEQMKIPSSGNRR